MRDRNIAKHDNWKTPPELYEKLDAEFHFDFDPCPYCEGTPEVDGLTIEWGSSSYVNPPYSKALKEAFVKKSIEQANKGKLVVMLLPVSTSTKLFHDYILPNKSEIRFIRGRVKFHGRDGNGNWSTKNNGMHDSMLVIFDGRTK